MARLTKKQLQNLMLDKSLVARLNQYSQPKGKKLLHAIAKQVKQRETEY
jgi:hypothetical protein